jgi:frataxin-like iron-binding protein CyaY
LVYEIEFPAETAINGKESNAYFRDSFKLTTNKVNLDAKNVYHSIFGFLPTPVQWALKIRNTIVKCFGFSASNTKMSLPLEDIVAGKKAGFLTIEAVSETEVICSAYEPNMDMWLSVLKLSEKEFAVSTLVNLKTTSGKCYMTLVKPFHKFVAKYCIKQALKTGRI